MNWAAPKNRSLLLLAVVLPLAGAGCRDSSPSPPVATKTAAEKIDEKTQAAQADDDSKRVPLGPPLPFPASATTSGPPLPEEPTDNAPISEEIWEAVSIQGNRVGYTHTTVATVQEEGRELVRTRAYSRTSLKRDGQPIQQVMIATSWETPSGELVRFETRMTTGPGEIAARGHVAAEQLAIEVSTAGKTQSEMIPWKSEWGGFFAADQSLKRQPMKPGETRTVRALMPILNVLASTQMTAVDYETVKLPSGEKRLLKIAQVVDLGGQKIESFVWVNDAGETQRSVVPSMQQESLRTTRADALAPIDNAFDLLIASTAPLKGSLPDPTSTRRVIYRATVTSGNIEGLFVDCLSQQVKQIDEQTAELTVLAIRPDQPPMPGREIPSPTAGDLAASNLIQSDSPAVIKMAEAGTRGMGTDWEIACELERHVARSIRKKNFSQAFATAAEVAESLEGDCTEHAVLLAALCRVKKIPSRVAFGLVYYPPQAGFAYHMWNEVWIGDRWVPLDGTLGRGGIGADHIKLADSNLSGAAAYAGMMSVVQVLGRLRLEVVEVE